MPLYINSRWRRWCARIFRKSRLCWRPLFFFFFSTVGELFAKQIVVERVSAVVADDELQACIIWFSARIRHRRENRIDKITAHLHRWRFRLHPQARAELAKLGLYDGEVVVAFFGSRVLAHPRRVAINKQPCPVSMISPHKFPAQRRRSVLWSAQAYFINLYAALAFYLVYGASDVWIDIEVEGDVERQAAVIERGSVAVRFIFYTVDGIVEEFVKLSARLLVAPLAECVNGVVVRICLFQALQECPEFGRQKTVVGGSAVVRCIAEAYRFSGSGSLTFQRQ